MEKALNDFLAVNNKVKDIKLTVICNEAGDTYHTAMVVYDE